MNWGYYIILYWIASVVILTICYLVSDNRMKANIKRMERGQLWIIVLCFPLLILFYLIKYIVLYICSLLRRFIGLIHDTFCPKSAQIRKEKTDLYISIARNFEQMLSDVAYRNIDADKVLTILNCIALDNNCHIGYRPTDYNNGKRGDNANLYWYEGEDRQNGRQSHSDRCIHRLLTPEINSNKNTVFEHLSVEKSELGAWQAYLLSVSSAMLPRGGNGLYYTSFFVYTKDDVMNIRSEGNRLIWWLCEDVSPNVWIKNDTAYVSCCYWNDWDGLLRETIALKYEGNHITRIEMVKEKKLYRNSNSTIL